MPVDLTCPVCKGKGLEDGCPACGRKVGQVAKKKQEASGCVICGGKGFPGGCPQCKKDSLMGGHDEEIAVTAEAVKSLLIPAQYTRVRWDPNQLCRSHPDVKNPDELARYAKLLTNLYQVFEAGLIPVRSAFIVAPRTYAKNTLAYCCMIQALKHKYSVAPLIDNMQYKRMRRLASDRPYGKALKDMPIDIEGYDNADVVFMTIDPSNYLESFNVVEGLVTRRARIGKPTIILSRFTVNQLAYYCNGANYKTFLNNGSQTDAFKYPSLYSYWEQRV